MQQEKIRELLIEASQCNCSWQRRTQIQVDLKNASAALGHDGVYEIDTKAAGLALILEKLYVDTLEVAPHILPSLFPVFALICGDREQSFVVADIEWDIFLPDEKDL